MKPPALVFSHTRPDKPRELIVLEHGSAIFERIDGRPAGYLTGEIRILPHMIYNGRQFRIRFEHIRPPASVIALDSKAKVITVAQVQMLEGPAGAESEPKVWVTIFEGETKQRPAKFKRAVGRKVALTRALLHDRALLLNKDFRRAVWYTYWHSLGLNLNDKDYQR